MSNYCVDSGFLFALYSPRDQRDYREKAREYFGSFKNRANKFVLPWPVMFEAINTAVCTYQPGLELFARNLRDFRASDQLVTIDDAPYRERALQECLTQGNRPDRRGRGISLVDYVLRLILADTKLRFDGLITLDVGHFRDVCLSRQITLLSLRADA
jgi:hypothetical protein